ncbi:hypothetical protein [Pseudophaeobacter sp.]|uniref:hypothetical protein n=1 Tax=Pseudophaeobacter sp. TaxID=1971739 RepID=UPI00329A6E04
MGNPGKNLQILSAAKQVLTKAKLANQRHSDIRITHQSEGEGPETLKLRELATQSLRPAEVNAAPLQ